MAALATLFPFGALEAMAQEKGKIEKKDLKVGFIPITCATPLIMSSPLGFYEKQGLNVTLVKTAGWALIRDKVMNKEYDASHLLAPMPLAISLGVGSGALPMNVATIQNSNGQAITLALKHKDNRDPKNWKGFKFAVPFEFSMHNFLLRYYLAEHGLDPDKRRADPRGAAARDGRQPARRQHRRLPRPGPLQPARGVRPGGLHPPAHARSCGTAIRAAPSARAPSG